MVNQRNKTIQLKLDKETKKNWQRVADYENLPLTTWARAIVQKYVNSVLEDEDE